MNNGTQGVRIFIELMDNKNGLLLRFLGRKRLVYRKESVPSIFCVFALHVLKEQQ